MSRSGPRPSDLASTAAPTSFLPPSHKLLQLASARRARHPVHATDLRTTKFYKTKMCPFMQNKRGGGRCSEGFDCGYAHAVEELRNAPDLQRTKWCSKVLNGLRCTDPKCGYAHCAQELQPSKDRQTLKTSLCLFWAKDPKFCLNGDKCRFAHGLGDLRKRLALPPRCPSPLINSLATCNESLYSFIVPAREDPTVKTAVALTDVCDSLTAVPPADTGFAASSEGVPLPPWRAEPYASCHSVISNAFSSRFFSDCRTSVFESKECTQELPVQSRASVENTFSETSRQVLPFEELSSWGKRCSEYDDEATARTSDLLTWLPNDTQEEGFASENATTHLVDGGSFSAATTVGLEEAEASCPAFPLFPPHLSRSEETGGGNEKRSHPRLGSASCTLALDSVEPQDSPRLPYPCGSPLEDPPRWRKELEERLIRRMAFDCAVRPQQPHFPVTLAPFAAQTETHSTTKQVNDIINFKRPQVSVASGLSKAHEKEVGRADVDPPCSCPRPWNSDAYTRKALFESQPQQVVVEGQTAPLLSQFHLSRGGVTFARTREYCRVPHCGVLPTVTSATADAEAGIGRHFHGWAANNAVDPEVPGITSSSDSTVGTFKSPQEKAARQPVQREYSSANSEKSCQAKRVLTDAESLKQLGFSTAARRPRRNGGNWEHVDAFVADWGANAVHKKRSLSVSDGARPWHHADGVEASAKSLLGSPGTVKGLNKTKCTLNAHAPPFYPRTLLGFTCCEQGGIAKTARQGSHCKPRGLVNHSDTVCSVTPESFISVSRTDKEDMPENAGVPLWQTAWGVWCAEGYQQRQQQHSAMSTLERRCSNSSLPLEGGHRPDRLDAYRASQPAASTASEARKFKSRQNQQTPLACLRGVASAGGGEALPVTASGSGNDGFFFSLARIASVRRLPVRQPLTVEAGESTAVHDAIMSSRHAFYTCDEGAREKGLLRHHSHTFSHDRPLPSRSELPDGPRACGEEPHVAAVISNNSSCSAQRVQGHAALVSAPYAVLQEALWLKPKAATEHEGGHSAHLVIRDAAHPLISNNSSCSAQRAHGHAALVSAPYAVLQEALWLKPKAATEHEGGHSAHLVIRDATAHLYGGAFSAGCQRKEE